MGALETTGSVTGKPKISDEERRKRQEAVDFAIANLGLEGFKPTPESLQDDKLFVNGDIDIDEKIARAIKRAHEPR